MGKVAGRRRPQKLRLAEADQPAGGKREGRIGFEQGHRAFQERRLENVGGVQKRNITSGGLADPQVPGPGEALVLRPEDARPRPAIRGEEVPRHRIGRAVVDQEDLEVRVGLVEDALNGLVHVGAEVVAGDHDCD